MRDFDSLVLLIGTNPLPNLVVLEHFIKNMPIKKVYLIHSAKTQFYDGTLAEAERLEEVLKDRHKDSKDLFPLEKIALLDISSANEIRREVQEKLIDKLSPDSKIHLNYTGGTKAMGIHVYNALKESQNIKEKSFSYLDARTYKIVDDENGYITGDLRETIKISFDEMVNLHGLNRVNKDRDSSEFKDTLNFFKEMILTCKIDNYFRYYIRQLFENKKGGLAERTKDLKEEMKNTQICGILLEVFKTLPEKWRFFNGNGEYVEPVDKNIKSALMYIDGLWLEDYVYEALKEKCPDFAFYKNWEIKKTNWQDYSKFEIDIAAIKGYQLIGISCTTSNVQSLCKSKGFEILLRTRQIGGDEAKAVLITRLPDDKVEILQDSLRADTAGVDNILVLGKEDLKKERLIEEFEKFIT